MTKFNAEDKKKHILKQLKAIGVIPKDKHESIKSPFYSSVSGRSKGKIEIKD